MKALKIISFLFFLTQFLFAQQIINVKSFGAKADGINDDTKAIQKAIDSAPANSIIFFPEGIYLVTRKSHAEAGCIYLKSNCTLQGERMKSIIKLLPQQENFTRIIYIEKIGQVQMFNLIFDGNSLEQIKNGKLNEHLHSVFINEGKQIKIKNCGFKNAGGDGIGIRGLGKNPSANILIDSCFFSNSHRDAITLGSGFNYIEISHCNFDSTIKSSIHTEPQSGITEDVYIHHNFFINCYNLSIGGADTMHLANNFRIENNLFVNCFTWCCRSKNISIQNNHFLFTKKMSCQSAIALIQKNDSIFILDNSFDLKGNNYAVSLSSTTSQVGTVVFSRNEVTTNFVLFKDYGAKCFTIKQNNFKTDEKYALMDLVINYQIESTSFKDNLFSTKQFWGITKSSKHNFVNHLILDGKNLELLKKLNFVKEFKFME